MSKRITETVQNKEPNISTKFCWLYVSCWHLTLALYSNPSWNCTLSDFLAVAVDIYQLFACLHRWFISLRSDPNVTKLLSARFKAKTEVLPSSSLYSGLRERHVYFYLVFADQSHLPVCQSTSMLFLQKKNISWNGKYFLDNSGERK